MSLQRHILPYYNILNLLIKFITQVPYIIYTGIEHALHKQILHRQEN